MNFLLLFLSLTGFHITPPCTFERAKELSGEGKYTEAIDCLHTLLADDSLKVYNELGDIYYHLQETDSARKYYHKVVNSGTASNLALLNLGDLEFKYGNFKQSLTLFKTIEQRDPMFTHLNLNLATLYVIAFNSNDSALLYAYREMRMDSTSDDILAVMGQIFLNKEWNARAMYYFSKAEQVNPKNFLAVFKQGIIYEYVEHDLEKAYNAYERSCRINKDFTDGYIQKITVGYQLKKPDVCRDIEWLKSSNAQLGVDIREIEAEYCN